ncbi:hypothetical protein Tco_1289749 [Tanacetum coccineum]
MLWSWKPYQGDSLNLPAHRIHKSDGDGMPSIQLKIANLYKGDCLASLQKMMQSYEHVGLKTQDRKGWQSSSRSSKEKILKISDIMSEAQRTHDKRLKIKDHKAEGTSLQNEFQRPRPQVLNDNNNLIDLTRECHNELTSGEIVSLKYWLEQ